MFAEFLLTSHIYISLRVKTVCRAKTHSQQESTCLTPSPYWRSAVLFVSSSATGCFPFFLEPSEKTGWRLPLLVVDVFLFLFFIFMVADGAAAFVFILKFFLLSCDAISVGSWPRGWSPNLHPRHPPRRSSQPSCVTNIGRARACARTTPPSVHPRSCNPAGSPVSAPILS